MARVTIEDCIPHVENRFKLVLVAAQRARDVLAGSPLLVPEDEYKGDKEDVLALREISTGLINCAALDEAIIKKHQKYQPFAENDSFDSVSSQDKLGKTERSSAQSGGNEIITNMYASESCEEGFASSSDDSVFQDTSAEDDDLENA